MKEKHLAVIALVICALGFGASAFMHSWRVAAKPETGEGLIAERDCYELSDKCEVVSYRAVGPDAYLIWLGRAAFACTLTASVLAALAAGLLSQQRPRQSRYFVAALAGSVGSVVLFIVLFIADENSILRFGPAFYLYSLGAVAGVVGQVFGRRALVEASA